MEGQASPMTSLLLIPLDDTVVFPTMDVTLPVDVGDDDRVLLVPRHGAEFAKVGAIARVADRVRLPGGGSAPRAPRRSPPAPRRRARGVPLRRDARHRRRRWQRCTRPPARRGRG